MLNGDAIKPHEIPNTVNFAAAFLLFAQRKARIGITSNKISANCFIVNR